MNVTLRIEDEEWESLLADIAEHFSDVTIKRGFQYYKQNRVRTLALRGSSRLEAAVQGTERYAVTIELNALEGCTCNCTAGRFCKHMAAVLFAYVHEAGRSVNELANVKWRRNPKTAPFLHASSAEQRADRAAALRASMREAENAAARLADAGVAEWHEYFAERLAPLADRHRNDMYVREAERLLLGILPDMPETDVLLYELNARFHLLRELFRSSEAGGSFVGYFTHLAAAVVEDAANRRLAEYMRRPAPPARPDRVKDTLTLLRDAMARGGEAGIRVNRYYLNVLHAVVQPYADNEAIFAEEWGEWQRMDAKQLHKSAKHTRALAMCRLAFALGRDDDAQACLREADDTGSIETNFLLALLEEVEDAGPPARLLYWLEASAPYVRTRRPQELQAYAAYWEALLERSPDAEPRMWDTIAGMFPYTQDMYSELLFTKGRYRQWIDYHLTALTDPLSLRARDLQPIEKEAPELLLPFYHQGVERYVALRNRDGYKRAVKLLKRLAKLYKKLHRDARWDAFIEAFAGRHSRLRALQEEMRKGSLL